MCTIGRRASGLGLAWRFLLTQYELYLTYNHSRAHKWVTSAIFIGLISTMNLQVGLGWRGVDWFIAWQGDASQLVASMLFGVVISWEP